MIRWKLYAIGLATASVLVFPGVASADTLPGDTYATYTTCGNWLDAYNSDASRFDSMSLSDEVDIYGGTKPWFDAYRTARQAFTDERQAVYDYCVENGYTEQAEDVASVMTTGGTVSIYQSKVAYVDSVKDTVAADIQRKRVPSATAREVVPSASNATAASIDAYLAGSPLAGYGQVFYDAAIANGLDPRLLPAISCIESSKGAHCFREHNAWGWGNVSWPDWTTAIYAMASGVASGYGSGATPASMGPVYCPGSSSWINNVTSEMGRM